MDGEGRITMKKKKKEIQKWRNNVEKALEKYSYMKKWEEDFYNPYNLSFAFKMARDKGDYDAAAILMQAYRNAIENKKAQKEEAQTEKPTCKARL